MNNQSDDNTSARLKKILRYIYDTAKVQLMRIMRESGKQLRIVGPPIFAWLMKHKASVAIVLLVLYIVIIPRCAERKLADAQPLVTVAPTDSTPRNLTPTTRAMMPTTQATTEPAIPRSIGELPLYSPDSEGFDPQWGLPADLQGEDLQTFVRQVQKLTDDTMKTMQLEQQYYELVGSLIDPKIANVFWQRLLGSGFMDKSLPHDWYEIVKNYNGMLATLATVAESVANGTAQVTILARIGTVRVRIIGGNVIGADRLFVNGLQSYIDRRLPYLQREVPQVQNVANRTSKEFRKEFHKELSGE